MKKILLVSLTVFASIFTLAKDITVNMSNKSGQTITLKYAVFGKADIVPNDTELFNNQNVGKFTDLFSNVASQDAIYSDKIIRLPDEGIIVFVGIYSLGGRTYVRRANLNQFDKKRKALTINYEKPLNAVEASVNLDKFKEQIPADLYADYTDLIKQQIFGSFLLAVEEEKGKYKSALPLLPKETSDFVRYSRNFYKAEDVFSRDVLANLNLQLPSLPLAFKAAFSMKNFSHVRCEIYNSGKVDIIPKAGRSYYELFTSLSNDDLELALNAYQQNTGKTKLLLVISANVIDSMVYASQELQKIDAAAEIDVKCIATAEANYNLVKNSTQLNYEVKKVGAVNIRDFSDYLRQELAKRELKKAEEAKKSKDFAAIKAIYLKLSQNFPTLIKQGLTNEEEIRKEIENFSKIEIKKDGEEVQLNKAQLENIQKVISSQDQ